MKKFNLAKFCEDLISLRADLTQSDFAQKLGVNRSSLSLLESGKQIPSLKILTTFCDLKKCETDNYFIDNENNGLIYLMGTLEESDKIIINETMERIRIKEKYELLNRKGNYGISRR